MSFVCLVDASLIALFSLVFFYLSATSSKTLTLPSFVVWAIGLAVCGGFWFWFMFYSLMPPLRSLVLGPILPLATVLLIFPYSPFFWSSSNVFAVLDLLLLLFICTIFSFFSIYSLSLFCWLSSSRSSSASIALFASLALLCLSSPEILCFRSVLTVFYSV